MARARTEIADEISKFNALAANWWDPNGPMAPLHWMNPARLDFVQRNLAATGIKPPSTGVDIGCGAGLLTEPLARYGFRMTGIDGAADAITVAQDHAGHERLKIGYRQAYSSDIARTKQKFDFVTALEIIEHVEDPKEFIDEIVSLLNKRGTLFISTLNRTLKSKIFSVYLAEHILRALPVGTHEADKFIRPSELAGWLQSAGCEIVEMAGLVFQPLKRSFRLDPHDPDINYIICARKL